MSNKALIFMPLLFSVTFLCAFKGDKSMLNHAPGKSENLQASPSEMPLSPIYRHQNQAKLFASEQDTVVKPTQPRAKPLYVIDGKIQTYQTLQNIPITPDSIGYIQVLKDQNALDAYGDKGKNGVIEITTKTESKKIRSRQLANLIAPQAIPQPKNYRKKNLNFHSNRPRPLFVIDGKEVNADTLKSLDKNKIDSITILKDAKAISKYGDKGRNGVVEIKMKHNSAEDTKASNVNSKELYIQKNMTDPSFPGGKKAWKYFLDTNLKLEIPLNNDAPAGTYDIVVSFMVSATGEVSEVTAISKPEIDYGCADEAVRLIKNSGKWIPATEDGKNIPFRNRQKITFVIDK